MSAVGLEKGRLGIARRGRISRCRNLAGVGLLLLHARIATAQGPPFQPPMQPPMGPFGGRG